MKKEYMILGQDALYNMNCYETKLNNNVLVVGASGTGKTRGIVIPNLLMANGSYVISDPKGNLYRKYGSYLKKQGYTVRRLDFADPANSEQYNFFHYIESSMDIVRIAHMIVYASPGRSNDPFWDEAAQILLESLIAFLWENYDPSDQTPSNVSKLLDIAEIDENDAATESPLDVLFREAGEKNPNSFAVKLYNSYRIGAGKTLKSILISLNAKLFLFTTPEITSMTNDNSFEIADLGRKKTALFVNVSDSDRSLDTLINIFFSQAMNALCRFADTKCPDSRLPVPVRFILDDFATNCVITDFPRMISSIRSRGISVMLMIQAESQLEQYYKNDASTIIGNCDSYVYLGGNDLETARRIAERCNLPLKKILFMPLGTSWIFRRGAEPRQCENFDLDSLFVGSMPVKEER
ncbi:MAG: type IV secretory system conjugative DNA transfer family protein [Lachnospiraceae bacterium]|nr:type IV secretory system conjugative DNA transfer family protein [Lachnospiraceae bacterium]